MSDYKPSAQLTEAVAAAMMEELGSARLDSLPLEDRARDHAYREGTHNNRPGRAKQPNMMQHLSQPAANGGGGLASMWQAAVNSNVFDDIDAQAVRGLSDLGGGRVYVKQGVRKAQAMLKSTGTLQAPSGQGRFSANPATQALQAFPKAGAKGGFAPVMPAQTPGNRSNISARGTTNSSLGTKTSPIPPHSSMNKAHAAMPAAMQGVQVAGPRPQQPHRAHQGVQSAFASLPKQPEKGAQKAVQKMVPRPADAKTASPSRMDQPAIEPPKNVLSQYPVLYKSLDGTATSAVVFLCAEHQPELGWLYLYSGREMMARCSLATWHNYLNSDKDLIAQFKGSSQKITTYTLGFSSPSSAMEFLKMVLELKAGKYLNQVTDKASAPAAQKAATAGPALGQASASTIPNAARVSSKISQVVTTAPSIVQELNAAAQQTSLPCDTSHSRKNAAVNSHYRSQPKSVSGPQKTATRTPENASVVSAGPGVISTSCPKDHPDVQRLTKQLEELKLNSPEKGPRSLQNTLIENKDQSSLATKNISARDCAQSMSLIDLDESQVVKRRLPSASEDLASLEPFEYPPSPSVPGDVISMQMTSGAETLGSTLNSEETVLDSLRETARQVLGSCLLQGQAGNTKAEIGNFFQGVVLAIGEAYIKSNDDLAALDDEAQRKAMKDFVAVFFQKSMSDLFQDTDHQAQDTNSASSPGRPEVAQAGAKTQKPQDVPNTTGMAANTRYSVEQLVSGPVVKNPDVLQPGAKSTVNANTETTGVSDKPGVFENVTKAQSTKTTAHANGNGLEESKLVDINHRATLTTKQARKDEGLLASKWATEEDSLVNEKNFTGPAYEFPANSNLWLLAELDPETGLDTKPEIPSNDVANFFLSGPPTQPESTLPTPSQTSSESGKIVLSGPMSSASSVTRGFKGLKASRWA